MKKDSKVVQQQKGNVTEKAAQIPCLLYEKYCLHCYMYTDEF